MFKIATSKILIKRARQGLSLEDLVTKACLKHETISRIERGLVNPRLSTIGKIAKALKKDLEEFLIMETTDTSN